MYGTDSRGMGLDQICQEVFMSGKSYIVVENPRYHFQYRCVAKVKRRYLTVVCEDIEDQSAPFTRIVTYWDSESHEKEKFKL